jgi:hypothetical protein
LESKFIKRDSILYDVNSRFYQYDCYLKTFNSFTAEKNAEMEKYLRENFTEKEIQFIRTRSIFVGMSEKAMIESLGYPMEGINEVVIDNISLKQYVYDTGQYVYIENGRVRGWEKFQF